MKIIETRVTVSAIHLWLANDSELHNATAWLELELPLESLDLAERHSVADARRAALTVIRGALDKELDRLGASTRRRPPPGLDSPSPTTRPPRLITLQ